MVCPSRERGAEWDARARSQEPGLEPVLEFTIKSRLEMPILRISFSTGSRFPSVRHAHASAAVPQTRGGPRHPRRLPRSEVDWARAVRRRWLDRPSSGCQPVWKRILPKVIVRELNSPWGMVSRASFPLASDDPIFPMQTNPVSEIDPSDLAAARELLSADLPEASQSQPAPVPTSSAHGPGSRETRGAVTIHNGITRARTRSRSAAKTSASA